MKVQLLVSEWCPSCPQAEKIWTEAAQRVPVELEILDVADRKGRCAKTGVNALRPSACARIHGDRLQAQ